MQSMKLSVLYSAVDKVSGPLKKMRENVVSFDKILRGSKAMREWGQEISVSAISAMTAAEKMKTHAKDLLYPYQELQKEIFTLDKVIISSGKNHAGSMDAAIKAAKDWEKQHGDAAAKFINTTSRMSEASLKEIDAIRGSRYALGLQKATMTDVEVTGELLITTYKTLGDRTKSAADEMKKHADITTKVQQIYKLRNLNDFTGAMKEAAPAAETMGQSYEEAAAAVATLQKSGWDAAKAGQGYTAVIKNLANAQDQLGVAVVKNDKGAIDFARTIDNLTNKYGDLRKVTPQLREQLVKIFGEDGVKALEEYQRQTGVIKKNIGELSNATGALAAARDAYEDSAAGRMEKAMQKMDSLKVGIAEKIFGNPAVVEKIIPAFISAAEAAADMVAAFAEADPEMASAVITIIGLGLGIMALGAPITAAIGSFLTLSGTVVSACGASGKGIIKLYKLIEASKALEKGTAAASTFSKGLGAVGKFSKTAALGVFNFGKSAILTATTALPGLIASTWAFTAALLANPMTWVVIGIMALIGAIILCIKYWDDISAACGAAWEWIKETASAGIDFLMKLPQRYLDFLGTIGDSFFESGQALWNTFAEGILSVVKAPYNAIKRGLEFVDNLMPHSDAREGPLSALTLSGTRLMTTLAAGVPKGAKKLYDTVGKALNNVQLPGEEWGQPEQRENPFSIKAGSIIPKTPDWLKSTDFPSIKGGGRPLIQGPITIKVQQMNSPEDFMGALQELAGETGA